MRADELAGAARLPVSTVYRYLRALREYGLVTVQDGVHAPGWALDRPAGPRVSRSDLIESATPVLRGLAQATRETAALSVRVGTHAVCVQQVKSPQSVRVAFEIGQILPLHAGASERVLLAYAPDQVVHTLLSGELRQYTPSTPNHLNLASKLRSTRAAGVATSRGEFTPDAIAVAAPVLCDGEIVCAIEVAGPDRRCGHEWLMRTKELIADAVRGLGSAMEAVPLGAPAS
ncbi:MAG: IclR family transcriptional regulator [Actinomycetota bacterium]|nr:IclR family transcriptional regulator [Actinomycetota bacterium]